MSDQGLSIFDDEPERPAGDGDKTQVIPTVGSGPAAPAGAKAAPQAGSGAQRSAPPAKPAGAAAAGRAETPSFPTVRRGGYDASAVDTKVRQLVGEKSGLSSALAESERRVAELQREVATAREELAESERP